MKPAQIKIKGCACAWYVKEAMKKMRQEHLVACTETEHWYFFSWGEKMMNSMVGIAKLKQACHVLWWSGIANQWSGSSPTL